MFCKSYLLFLPFHFHGFHHWTKIQGCQAQLSRHKAQGANDAQRSRMENSKIKEPSISWGGCLPHVSLS